MTIWRTRGGMLVLVVLGLVLGWLVWIAPPAPPPVPPSAPLEPGPSNEVVEPRLVPDESEGEPEREAANGETAEALSDLHVIAVAAESDAPLAGVALTVESTKEGVAFDALEGVTDDAGRRSFRVPPHITVKVTATAPPGRVDRSRTLYTNDAGRKRDVILKLHRERFFHGVVTRVEDGEPVPGATIVATGDPAVAARTDDGGRFELRPAPGTRSVGEVTADGYGPGVFQVDDDHATEASALSIRLERSARLRVQVVESGGAPFAGYEVELVTDAYEIAHPREAYVSGDEPRFQGDVDARGACVIDGLPPRVPLRTVLRDGDGVERRHVPDLVFEPGEDRRLEWTIGGGVSLIGRLVDQLGMPVNGRGVWLAQRILAGAPQERPAFYYTGDADKIVEEARTDAAGRFSFDDVAPGRWWLGPAAKRHTWEEPRAGEVADLAAVVDVPAGVARHEVEVIAWRGLYIEGTVLAPDGSVAERASVRLTTPQFGGFQRAVTEKGSFRLGPLPDGLFRLVGNGFRDFVDSEPVMARPGDAGVVLRLREGGGVAGRVIDGVSGAPVAGASVYLSQEGEQYGLRIMSTDAEGRYDASALDPGLYRFGAATSDGRAGTRGGVRVSIGAKVVVPDIAVSPGGRLEVRYIGPETYAQFQVATPDGVVVAADGIHTEDVGQHTVPAGEMTVSIRMRDHREERMVQIDPGGRIEVLFDLRDE